MSITDLKRSFTSSGKGPTSADILTWALKGEDLTGIDHKVILTGRLLRTGNGELHIYIEDDPYITFPDHKDRPLAARWAVPTRDDLHARKTGLSHLARISAGVVLSVKDDSGEIKTVGLERGRFAPDNPKQMIPNSGKISCMNGGMMMENGTMLLPSRLAAMEMNEELAVMNNNNDLLLLSHGTDILHALYDGKHEQILKLRQGGLIEEPVLDVWHQPLKSDDSTPGVATVRTFLRGQQVDETRAFPYYDGGIGSLELLHRFQVQLQGNIGEYRFISCEPLGGNVHLIESADDFQGQLTKHFLGALQGHHGDLELLPVAEHGARGVCFTGANPRNRPS